MKLLKKTLAAIATVGTLTAAGSANAYLTNWYLDADGAGPNAAVQVSEYVDLNGYAYIQNTFSSATQFTFNEVGSYLSTLVDSNTALPTMLTSSFVGSGVGNTTSGISFTPGGTLTVKSGATTIGLFSLVAGGAALNNAVVPNGFVSLAFEATYLANGYFFTDAGMTDDLANRVAGGSLVFGFTSTNASLLSHWNGTTDSTLTNLWNANFTPTISNIASNGSTELVLSNNGQYRMQVPEPASLALVGISLLGIGALRRRNTK